ncbi:D-glycero-beta-D-manno-heptose 1-phosphate adenylyltransferase [Rhodococcus sovatensis]|uniref:D-glycero-beta-D-manno-heptose 1-phosphate adenylyltransferase n=1 Tax=Rhodococcus sovatensis TaxID=1805840 RepID=A0ABZ2PSH9_9NOCA
MTRPLLVVVGDALLDVDIDGTATRLSPEAPVPVVDIARQWQRPGGAGLAALLAARSGHPTVLITALGHDDPGIRLRALLDAHVDVIDLPYQGETACKTRVQASGHPVVRLDSGGGHFVDGPLPSRAIEAIDSAGSILVSDYGRGVAGSKAVRTALSARRPDVPLVWDPHPRGSAPIAGTTVVTPNSDEADREVGNVVRPDDRGDELCTRWGALAAAITVGVRGAVLTTAAGATTHVAPEYSGTVSPTGDTCGAGDCFAAAASVALLEGTDVATAIRRAVDAASSFVADGGAVAISTCEGPVVSNSRPAQPEVTRDGFELAEHIRRTGGRIVATGGCFDLLHRGHVSLLRQARLLGDVLIVCLNSDDSVARAKGPSRPLITQADRARVLSELSSVDAVVIFDEDTPEQVLARLRPDVWVKGGDYTDRPIPESDVVSSGGGKTVVLPTLQGYSTTGIVDGINATRMSIL